MNIHCLEEQQDLFEIAVLSQIAEVIPVSADGASRGELNYPLVVLGSYLTAERANLFQELIRAIHRGRHPLLLLPPFHLQELQTYLDLPVPLSLEQREQGPVKLVDTTLVGMLGRSTVQIRNSEGLRSSLHAGVLALDKVGLPVVLRYQPKNTLAPIIISTLQLLTYSAVSDELDREALLKALLSYPYVIAEKKNSTERAGVNQKSINVSPEDLRAVAVVLAVIPKQSRSELLTMLAERLYYPIREDLLAAALEELSQQGLVEMGENWVQANTESMMRSVREWGLWAYVRELREMDH